MSISYFIKYIGIHSGHISDDYICRFNLIINSFKYTFIMENLFVNTHSNYAGFFSCGLDSKLVYVIEACVEGHQDERK